MLPGLDADHRRIKAPIDSIVAEEDPLVAWLSKVTDFFKFTTKQHAIVASTTGAILFLPTAVLKRLGLNEIPAPYSAIVGLAFIVSNVFVLAYSVSWCIAWYRRRAQSGELIQRLEGKLRNLDIGEQAVLREFLIYGQTAIRLPTSNPVVAGLISDGVLHLVSRIDRHSLHVPFILVPVGERGDSVDGP